MLRQVLTGAAAGAAGTTALNAVTYVDMVLRGRRSSTTPEDTVEALAQQAHVTIPGDGEKRGNRIAGLGPLLGLSAGVAVGAAYGAVVALSGRRPGLRTGMLATGMAALLAGNGPMTVLGVTDPRQWNAEAWVSDLVPHVVYGVVTAATFHATLEPLAR